ncbi:NADH:flavin oxidoreductase/NADH oxidase [Dichomitus squalens LYAD-421 SS1]|uniref:NADH:flavin oxidoreductase/NADH oxidase n=1 Tax=Dichomitus squalens (strain LYAD-421) TaxID=732165 RepID=R7SMY7_DICSQ|nr:NADH:flavin oxidoreductase/NADH oxidase [Dichomitus squalens LYAD-421 SS1]EJF57496.1 NADH:flavin oxidoreductase/NADH oxidase [Dichomitus squalens LYAD-421 SS1]
MSSTATPALFQPIQVGETKLKHRVVLAPLTRFRANKAHVHSDLAVEYYKQRASVPGTLLIAEATDIAPPAGGMAYVPGIYSDEQVAAWKKVTDAVHEQGSYIFLQLWAMGRAARAVGLRDEDADYPYVAPSAIPLKRSADDIPRELTKEEIKQYVDWFGEAAANAVHRAGFDGVEVHGAHGFLVDQFLQTVSNTRTDEYGGSIENRAKFALEVMESIASAVGQSRAAIRLSPWAQFHDMRMDDPIPTFTYLVEEFKKRLPNLAYLHSVGLGAPDQLGPEDKSQTDFIYKLWTPRPVVSTGGYDRETAIKIAEETGQLVGFGRLFLANPDLPFRLEKNIPLNPLEEETIYTRQAAEGYTTYPFSEEFLRSRSS